MLKYIHCRKTIKKRCKQINEKMEEIMKKRKYLIATLISLSIVAVVGCADKKQETSKEEKMSTADQVSGSEGGEDTEENSSEEENNNEETEQKVDNGEALEFKAEDYVTLGDYKKLPIQYPVPVVSEEDIKSYIDEKLDENTEYPEVKDRAAQEGDSVNIDYTGTVDGKEFEGGSDTEYDLILGSEDFLKEFEDGLVGKKTGETVTLPITFPEDYFDEEMAGKKAEFTVKINSISEVVVPEYNNDFVTKVSDFKTMEEYEESIREELFVSAQQESMVEAGENALTAAIGNAKVEKYPQALYDLCYNDTVEGYQFYASMMGMEYDEFVSEYMGEGGIEEATIDQVNEYLVVQAIAEKEGLAVTDESYKKDAEAMATEYEYDSFEDFENDYGKSYITLQITRSKVVDFLYESAELEEVSQEEYYKEEEEDGGEIEGGEEESQDVENEEEETQE